MTPVTLNDLSLSDCRLTCRASDLRNSYFAAMPEICTERPRLITSFHRRNDLLGRKRISILDKARAYRYVLQNRLPIVRHVEARAKGGTVLQMNRMSLFAGSTTSKFKGVPLYPEFLALALWPELWTMSTRASNPYYITDAEVAELNYDVFPYWVNNGIYETARDRCYEENLAKLGKKKHAPEMKLLERIVFFIASKPNCISHTIPDFSRAISQGLRAIINDADARRESTSNDSKKEFYAAIAEAMEGVTAFSRDLAAEAERLAGGEDDPVLKQEFLDLAQIHRHVPEFPARTFREGLTTVWVCWIAIHLENPNVGLSLGRLDQVLYDLYRQDIDQTTLTVQQAVELLCCLWLKIGDHVPTVPEAAEQLFGGTGSNQAITIGGVNTNGDDAVNDLTYVMLRATELMQLRDPNLNARYCPGVNSPDYLRRLCDTNIRTGATPALHNDKAVIKALTAKGESDEQARDYGVIGCVEPGSNGRSYGDSAAILLNLTSALELALFAGKHRHTGESLTINSETGDPTTFGSFEDFKDAFATQAHWLIGQAVALDGMLGKVHQDIYPTPILSALFEGPMEAGKDLVQGGAKVNYSGMTVIGLADVADSLSAIQKVVFEEGSVTFEELLRALKADFRGYEALHKRLANPDKTPKYGNEDRVADSNVAWIVDLLDEALSAKRNFCGASYRVGYWTMTNHAGFGMLMGAMPSGRRSGANFASGITPASGKADSLSEALNSVASLSPRRLSNGVALNLKYTPGDGPKMLDNFAASVAGYFDGPGGAENSGNGGMEIQFNITDRATFEDAVARPGEHTELLVRVSGYTAYFIDLSPQMQQEIINRTEYLLSAGRAKRYQWYQLGS